MMDKDVIRKMAMDCKHIVLPCLDCVERSISLWEGRIREECKRNADDKLRDIQTLAARFKSEAEKAQESNDRLSRLVTQLEKSNADLIKCLRDAKNDMSGLRAQLHAEQASRVRPVVVQE